MNRILPGLLTGLMLAGSPIHAEEPKKGGTVTGPVIANTLIENFNPYTQQAGANPSRGFIYEPMLFQNTLRNKVEYRLAESFEYSDDLKSVTFKLRDGLKWSDGKPLTTDDILFSHEMAKNDAKIDVYALWQGDKPKLSSIEALDKRTVKFTMAEPDSAVHGLIAAHYIVPKHIWAEQKDPVEFRNKKPVGSGPLTEIKNFKPQQMIVCRNPNYWDAGKPHVDCLKLRQFKGNDQVQTALMRGEIDWGSNFIPDVEKTFVAKDPENNHFWYPAGPTVSIFLNTTQKPMDNLAFRQAFSMALNRSEIVDLATYGYASENPHITGIGNFFREWYDKDVNAKYDYLNEYNPEKAKALLDEAGYKDTNGDGMRENPDGSEAKINIMVVNGWTDWVQTVQMATEYLREIGIDASTRTVEIGNLIENFKNAEYQAGILWGDVGSTPHSFYQNVLHTKGKGVALQANHGIYSDEMDSLLDEFTRTTDKARQLEISAKLQEFVAKNLMLIPIFSNPEWYQYSTSRFVGWPTEKDPYINPRFYDDGSRALMINNLHLK